IYVFGEKSVSNPPALMHMLPYNARYRYLQLQPTHQYIPSTTITTMTSRTPTSLLTLSLSHSLTHTLSLPHSMERNVNTKIALANCLILRMGIQNTTSGCKKRTQQQKTPNQTKSTTNE